MSSQLLRGADRGEWAVLVRRAWHGFLRHRGIDSAAALTFFAALTMFPGALTLVSATALFDARGDAVRDLLAVVQDVAQDSTVATLADPLQELLSIDNPAVALVAGLVLTVWSASAYATAFGRAMNTVYEVQEGRRLLKFRGLMIALSVLLMIVFAALALILLITPRVAAAIGRGAGIGEPWLSLWNFGKWPVLAVLLLLVVAVLFYVTPNVKHERMRWLGLGAGVALVVGGSATAGFALYVSSIGQYGRVYGWLGGGVVVLLWLYLVNLSLVAGAEADAEVTRLGLLRSGIDATETIPLPARDTARTLMLARQRTADETDSRAILQRSPKGS
ncbi:membrane protein [Diaminobutyricimonas aerilata]|uniref:Membrane protein n=1 Tax=Diaminobutyricimonas aerilata TaxID=1162967 RepID=A0A2M9CL07_9MICO|nr:YihY/virulence factor BrkB family protein [Diaminobutyricimonas aerilata]PJJ72574.1 membrane protein [Diaminobutyricimonas aerilata]